MEVRLAAQRLCRSSASIARTGTTSHLRPTCAANPIRFFGTSPSLRSPEALPPRPPLPSAAEIEADRQQASWPGRHPGNTQQQQQSSSATTTPSPAHTIGGNSKTPSWANKSSLRGIIPGLASYGGPGARDLGGVQNHLTRLGMPAGGYDLGVSVPAGLKDSMNLSDILGRGRVGAEKRSAADQRLLPQTGRTVSVTTAVDVAQALRILGAACRANNVAHDFRRDLFHERPGRKRKRLHSERWRARFSVGFRYAVTRARDLAKQGW